MQDCVGKGVNKNGWVLNSSGPSNWGQHKDKSQACGANASSVTLNNMIFDRTNSLNWEMEKVRVSIKTAMLVSRKALQLKEKNVCVYLKWLKWLGVLCDMLSHWCNGQRYKRNEITEISLSCPTQQTVFSVHLSVEIESHLTALFLIHATVEICDNAATGLNGLCFGSIAKFTSAYAFSYFFLTAELNYILMIDLICKHLNHNQCNI